MNSDFTDGFSLGYILAGGKKANGGISGKFRGINGLQPITISYDVPDEKDPKKTVTKTVEYTCDIETFEKVLSINITSNGETLSTVADTFSKTMVTHIYNSDGDSIFDADYDSDSGAVRDYYDSDGNSIFID